MLKGLFSMARVSLLKYEDNEIIGKVKSLYTTTLVQVDVDQEVVLDCAESIMEALDNDGDGEITKVF